MNGDRAEAIPLISASPPPVPGNDGASVGPATAEHRPRRVFVGLKVGPEITVELTRIAQELERFDVRRVAANDIHLTLVPPWNETSPSEAIEKLQLVAEQFDAFTLAIEHVGYGPDLYRPRLLWADCLANEELVALRTGLLDAFGRKDERPFHPHLTLARIGGNGRAVALKCPIDRQLSLTQQVKSVQLFQSPPPGQQGYQVLALAHLRIASQTSALDAD
jgi:2'-5' RNA ligase